MTNHWVDIKNADLVLIMGGNAAEAHICGFKWVQEAKEGRKARLVVVDPRFTRSAAVSDYYAPIRAGSPSSTVRLPKSRFLRNRASVHAGFKPFSQKILWWHVCNNGTQS